jgi:prephenate dehydratase
LPNAREPPARCACAAACRQGSPSIAEIAAYPGPAGSHSASAAEKLVPGGRGIALPTFSAVVDAAISREVTFGVLPIESSSSGPVAETHDLLYEAPLSIVAETMLHVSHCVVGIGTRDLSEVRTIRSHPVALDQCRLFLDSLPSVKRISSSTTADAAREVAEAGDPTQVAISGREAARLYELDIIAADVGDDPHTHTRFVAVAPYTRLDGAADDWRTSLAFVTDHRPGALFHALAPFAAHGIDLVQLVSRPLPKSRWRYRFDAVLAGHLLDDEVHAALRELSTLTRALRILGSYPPGVEP